MSIWNQKWIAVLLVIGLIGGCASQQTASIARTCAVTDEQIATLSEKVKEADPVSQLKLGEIYFDGICVRQDTERALSLLDQSATAGNADAQIYLAKLYSKGHKEKGVSSDSAGSLSYYQQAAAQGNGNAAYQIGLIHLEGRGVEKSPKTALDWFDHAEKNGFTVTKYWREKAECEVDPIDCPAAVAKRKKEAERIARQDEKKRLAEERKKNQLDWVKSSLGTIAVVVPLVEEDIKHPESTLTGIENKTLKMILAVPGGVVGGALMGVQAGAVEGAALGAVVGPFMAVGELMKKPSKRKIAKLQRKLTKSFEKFAETNLLNGLQSRIVEEAGSRLHNRVIAFEMEEYSDPVAYPVNLGFDSAIEIQEVVSGLQLLNIEKREARFHLGATLRVRKLSDDKILGEKTLRYSGKSTNLNSWIRFNGKALKAEAAKAYKDLAEEAVDKLLSLYDG